MRVLTNADAAAAGDALRRGEFLWIDLLAPTAADLEAIAPVLDLHPLAVEDSLEFGQRPKVDDYGDETLAVVFGARAAPGGEAVPVEVHVHFGATFLLTVRNEAELSLAGLHDHVAAEPPRPDDAIIYRVLDALADTLGPALDAQQALLEALSDEILVRPRGDHLERIVGLRRSCHALRRRLALQQEVFPRLKTAVLALPHLDEDAVPYLRDVGDHIAHAAADATAQAGATEAMADTYFNANANRMAVTSERLTVIATILLPMTLVTGFFGQNFGWLVDNIDTGWAFVVWGIGGLVVPLALSTAYLLARRRKVGRRAGYGPRS